MRDNGKEDVFGCEITRKRTLGKGGGGGGGADKRWGAHLPILSMWKNRGGGGGGWGGALAVLYGSCTMTNFSVWDLYHDCGISSGTPRENTLNAQAVQTHSPKIVMVRHGCYSPSSY